MALIERDLLQLFPIEKVSRGHEIYDYPSALLRLNHRVDQAALLIDGQIVEDVLEPRLPLERPQLFFISASPAF